MQVRNKIYSHMVFKLSIFSILQLRLYLKIGTFLIYWCIEESAMKLLLGSTPIALWRDIIHDAESICEATLQEELETYLVFLMARYTSKPEFVKQVLAIDFLNGM